MTSKLRLYGKKQPKLPKPVSAKRDAKEGFALRTIEQADARYSVVKRLRQNLAELLEDTNSRTFAARALGARAVHLAAYCESAELDLLQGKEVDRRLYLQFCRALGDALTKLGLKKEADHAENLSTIIDDLHRKAKKHHTNGKTTRNGKR